ncbi:MAG: LPS export ABC transporter periplasmic protein LptC [Thermoanaerobaculia bacterium]|nr:LPS export ABC transporter periplasmic protein LptC [Thermoanaerobaculia bacterium]
MQKAVRVLRVALPLAFVAFIAVIAVSWTRSGVTRDKTATLPVTSTQRPQDKPIIAATGFEDTQTIGGRTVSHIKAKRVIAFKSGWSTLEGVALTLYRANGLTYQVTCPQAQFNSETKEADAKGGVRVVSSDGVEISTAEIRYDGTRLTNDIPVTFRIDRWQGKGGALDLDVEGETIRLLKTVDATMTPPTKGDPGMTLRAEESVFRRRENDVTFTSNVVMTRGPDKLSGDRMVGKFTQDRKTLTAMEGNGNIVIAMSGAAAPGEDLGGTKTITCDRFFSEPSADGQLGAIIALGEPTLARALLAGPPRRDIVARSFRIALANRAVSELKAEWEVVMKETADVVREIGADHVTVSFEPQQHRATSALLEGNFRYRDPKTTASAVRANYDIAADRILLTAQPGFDPTIVSEGQTLKAKLIELSPKAGIAKATGEVIAQLVSTKQGGPSADTTNIFPAGSPVFVNSDQLIMRQSNKTAVFSGNVRAWQVTNTLLAQELQVQGAGQVMTARGEVRTVLYNAGSEARKTPVTSRSDQLIARRADRRIELVGSARVEDESRIMTAEHVSMYFDANRKIDRIEAENKVALLEKTTNRRANGDKATYFVQKKMAYLTGSPATAVEPSGTLSGQQIVFDLNRNRLQVLSPSGTTQGTYKQ